MTSRERILHALAGTQPDRVPFSPFLAYWWEAQPDALTDAGELTFLEQIGADPLFRGHYPMTGKNYEDAVLCKTRIDGCEIMQKTEGIRKTTTYHTAKEDLTLGYRYVERSNSWFLVEHPLAKEEDFQLLTDIMNATHLEPDLERYERETEQLGERGYILPLICPEMKTSFQSLLEKWVGTENLVYALIDFPEIVQETLDAMRRVSREAVEIAVQSSSPFFLSWEDTSTTNISPAYYEKYILPEINEWCGILHAHGKGYIQHACGHLHDLLPAMASSAIDGLGSLSPAPTGNVMLEDVADRFPKHISIIGGIEPVDLLESPIEVILNHAGHAMDVMQNRGYILSNSDSCPPGVTVEKLEALAKLVRNSRS